MRVGTSDLGMASSNLDFPTQRLSWFRDLKNEEICVECKKEEHTAYKMDRDEVIVAVQAAFDNNCFVPFFAIIHGIHFQEKWTGRFGCRNFYMVFTRGRVCESGMDAVLGNDGHGFNLAR